MLEWILIYILLGATCGMHWYQSSREEWLIRLIWITVLPVIGYLFLAVCHYAPKSKPDAAEDHPEEKEESISSRLGIYRRIDLEKEMNVIPMEEVLILNDNATKRKLLIDALKQDAIEDIHILEQAVQNEDTETSHYAATAVLEIKRKLLLDMQQFSIEYGRGSRELKVLAPYAQALRTYIDSGFLDDRTQRKYKYLYSHILESIVDHHSDQHDFFAEKINCDLELGDYDEARMYCKTFQKHHPDSEVPYVLEMKAYFMLRNYPKLQDTMKRLLSSHLKLTPGTLQFIRNLSVGA